MSDTKTKRIIRTLHKRGNSLAFTVPPEIRRLLAWNLNDSVTFDVVDGSLYVTKVRLPTAEHLRARSHDGAGHNV